MPLKVEKQPAEEHKIARITPTVVDGEGARSWLFIEVETDTGLVGVGEASQNRLDWGVVNQLEALATQYVGRSPLDLIEDRNRLLRRADAHRILYAACSGLEHALWDLCGQILGVPVYQLLGGSVRDRIRLYANIEVATRSKTPEEYAENASKAVAQGFTAVKFNPFRLALERNPRPEREVLALAVERVKQVRTAIGPNVDLLLDFAFSQDFHGALQAAQRIEPFDIFWIETPFRIDQAAQLAELRHRITTRLSAGEQLWGRTAFLQILEQRSLDVLMPDVKWIGGILEAKKVAAMAEAYDVAIAPHNMSGPIATAASVHLALTCPNFLILEYCWGVTPWRSDLVDGREIVVDGHIPLPTTPGLGVGLNHDVLRTHTMRKG